MQVEDQHQDAKASTERSSLMLFGAGQFSRSLLWCVTDLLIGYHLSVRIGFSGATTGTVLLASFAFGAVLNLLVAGWFANRANLVAIALKIQAIFGIGALAAAVMLFGPVPEDATAKIAYICLASAAFRISYTLFDVSQNALISLLPRNRQGVRRYVTTKTVVSSLGRLGASLLVFVALSAAAGQNADLWAVGFVALPVVVSVLGLSHITPPRRDVQEVPVRLALRSLPISRLAVPIMATVMEVGLLGFIARLLPLFESGRPGFADGSTLVVALVCGTIFGPGIAYACASLGLRRLRTIGLLSLSTTVAGSALLFPHGALACLGLAFAYGATLTAITNIIWEMMALIVVDEAAVSGNRIDAVAFALLSASINVAIALSNGILAIVLDGFKNDEPWTFGIIAAVVTAGGLGMWVILAAAQYRERRIVASQADSLASPKGSRLFFGTGASS